MASFFEKLKKGMGAELPEEEKEPEVSIEEVSPKTKKEKVRKAKKEPKESLELEVKKRDLEKGEKVPEEKKPPEFKEKWFESEGQLAIDVYQTDGELVIQSAIAGVKSDDLDISIDGDIILIRGVREKPLEEEKANYFYQECYWGSFSRQIILPEEADPGRAEATMKEGVLTIRIPKIEREKKRKLIVKT